MNKIKSIALPLSLIILIIAVSCYRFYISRTGKIFVSEIFIIGMYLLWLIFETRISLIDCVNKKTISDSGTREIYAIGQALTILSAIWFSPTFISLSVNHIAGIILYAIGISIRIWAIKTMGIFYSHTVRTIENHKIIDKGPYRFIRHPAYSGMILAHCGILLFFFNIITLIILIIIFIPAIIFRIIIEEKTLSNIVGYKEFARKRKRLIPGIW